MQLTREPSSRTVARRPRLGFVGLGWIGRHRMQALAESGLCEVVAVADPSAEARDAALQVAPAATGAAELDAVLAQRPDGVVIATPSAMHASQTIAALDAGAAVFCQKPLGRNAEETARAVAAARSADRLLATDLSYRHAAAFRAVQDLARSGALGEVFAVDLVFHNAYGPDKPWFRDRARSGGGCLIDLGIHLLDLGHWMLGDTDLRCRSAHLRSAGRPVGGSGAVEDFATATLESTAGAIVRLACSWNLPAGQDAVISVDVHGTGGGAAVRNVDGSFYDFTAFRHHGTARECLVVPPDDWGARAALAWAARLGRDGRCDPDCAQLVSLASGLDEIYRMAASG
ncbi:gfo/Idh/MocA family oxidoreductase [Rhodobacteraceae bacterium 2CG4]|uniref:Gfo/Idh/MocA family oxidoreductase n=1 Tax=Halovulum marinum TaxID=2662447 RepID=A0A6L5YY02_9RHOB|nr:Gfo/Idh/MocA family oxidoreductase [Halovulum marinum]MSU89206.1 gfo/Idh/MocA family oxidoreductase [Halovulum marinum]